MGETPERVEVDPKGRIIPDVNALVDNANTTVTNANVLIDDIRKVVQAIGDRGLAINGVLDFGSLKGSFQLTFRTL